MKRFQRFFRSIPSIISLCTGCMLALILLLLLFGQNSLSFAYQNASLLSNLTLYPAAAVCLGAFWLLSRRNLSYPGPWFIRGVFLIVLVLQFLVARTCWYHLGWDPGTVHATAEEIARGLPVSDPEYFITCPNNAPLAVLLAVPLWAGVKIGLGVPYVVLPYIDAVILNATAYVCVRCVERLTRSTAARLLAMVLSLGWLALSPYIIYPYTDVFSIVFPVAALYLYLTMRRPFPKWLAISFLCFAGGAIKPTVLIFLIALIITEVCRVLALRTVIRKGDWKRALLIAAALIIGMLPGKLFQDASTDWLTNGRADQTHLSVTHYLMLGMNDITYGGHSVDDVDFTLSHETIGEAQAANLQRAWERVRSRGVMGNLRFFSIKAYKAYADGSFASKGSFLDVGVPERTDALSHFLRRFYLRDGDLAPYAATLAQLIWLGVLTLCALAAVRQRKNPAAGLISLTLAGLTAYLLLFEVWPRYLFLFAPFFVILAAMAFDKPQKVMIK